MHDRDEFCPRVGLNIQGNMFDCRGNGVSGGKEGVHDDSEAFNLDVGLV